MMKRLKKKNQQAALQDIVQHLLVDENKGGGAVRRNSNAIKSLTTGNGKYQLVMKPGSREQVKKLFDDLKSRQHNEAASEEIKKDTEDVSQCFEEVFKLLRLEASEIKDPTVKDPLARVKGSFNLAHSTVELNERKRILDLIERKQANLEETITLPNGNKHPYYGQKAMLLYELKYYHASLEFRNIFFHRGQTEALLSEVNRVNRAITEQQDDKKKFKSLSARLFDSDQELCHVRRSLFYGELCNHMEDYLNNRLLVLESHRKDLFFLLESSDEEDGLLEVPCDDSIENKRAELRKIDIILEKIGKTMNITTEDRKYIKFDEFAKLQRTAQMWWAIMKMELKRMCEEELKEIAEKIEKSEKELSKIRWRLEIIDKQQNQRVSDDDDYFDHTQDPHQSSWDSWREPWEALTRKEQARYDQLKDRKNELEEIVQEDYEEVVNGPSTSKEVLNSIRQYMKNPEGCTNLIASLLKNMFTK